MQTAQISTRRFFCHKCNSETTANVDTATCANCNDGFIEEISNAVINASTGSSVPQIPRFHPNHPLSRLLIASSPSTSNSSRVFNNVAVSGTSNPNFLSQTLIEVVLAGNRFPLFTGMVGNPADYALGQTDFDQIVSQLMNRLDQSGPPPATDADLQKIPDRTIGPREADSQLSCPICFEPYQVDESVKQLPCQHLFHRDCVFVWLRSHGTCPVCRKNLSGEDTQVYSAADDVPAASFDSTAP